MRKLTDRLVDDARKRWRRWSVRLNAAGLAILSLGIDPTIALTVWNLMPDPIKAILPPRFLLLAGLILFAFAMLAVFVKQPSLDKRDG